MPNSCGRSSPFASIDMLSRPALLLLLSFVVSGTGNSQAPQQQTVLFVEPDKWHQLSLQVEGRLFPGVPFARSCFPFDENPFHAGSPANCTFVQAEYLNEVTRTDIFGSYINTQWETCQAVAGDQCLLDSVNPSNPNATSPPNRCQMGSVPNYFVDVRYPEDVVAAYSFSRQTGVPLVIKNTGHDYKGRSSAPGSLALWTHHLKNISYHENFVPDNCPDAGPAVTVGAGVQWGEAYAFAEAHNITLVGGSDQAVGVSGGWLQGGGHSALSNTMGLGIDRVLQFKIVTPDGQYRIANACQNKDLFFALRGGGGGTFGVVLESTLIASPRITLQTVIVAFEPNATVTERLFTLIVENGVKWAEDGWGGYANSETAIYLTPKLSHSQAAESIASLIEFGQHLQAEGVKGAKLVVLEFPSWGAFFQAFVGSHVAKVGRNLALASRLISKSAFETPSSRSALVSALMSANTATPGLLILAGPPSSFPGDGMTSVTNVWRDSIYHVTVVSEWNWSATPADKKACYERASESINHLRKITPDAAYLNEADVYEPNHEVAFWGTHYPELLTIKRKYDPDQLLDCWQCVGWNPQSARFACYL